MNEENSQVVQALRAKYPYQFHKSRFGVHITAGWLPRFVRLCDEVDQALGEDKRGFHWDGVDEKFGVANLGFGFHARKQVAIETRVLLEPIVAKARVELKDCCVVCGQHGSADPSQGYMLKRRALEEEKAKEEAERDSWRKPSTPDFDPVKEEKEPFEQEPRQMNDQAKTMIHAGATPREAQNFYTPADIERIEKALSSAQVPARPMTTTDALAELAPALAKARAKGHSLAGLVQLCEQQGLHVSERAIGRAITTARASKPAKKKPVPGQ
ncbi:MAG: hypothetical protein K2X75_05755 [Burkholderiaceae bacterium]|nr:hypothetical protein [Burkholderiaceae bacterium]